MNTAQVGNVIPETIFNTYSEFVLRNKEVSPEEAYRFVASARLRNVADFNNARMMKVKVGGTITPLLVALAN